MTSADIADGTVAAIDVNSAEVQLRVSQSCAAGSSIRQIDADGTVGCETDDNSGGTVTAVTASAPLQSTGGATPNVSLPDVIIGSLNTAIGVEALGSNTSGEGNTASGVQALASNTTGSSNTATGILALFSNTTGGGNTATGAQALSSNEAGERNTASGVHALFSNTDGGLNTASGTDALFSNTTGIQNTSTGDRALFANTTGTGNTASGANALFNNETGSNNTALGFNADVASDDLTNATALGANAVVNASNKIRLGDTNVTVIEGQVNFTASSDRNLKEHFKLVDGEAVLTRLRQVSVQSWNYIHEPTKDVRHYGPVAQDFFAAFGHDGLGTIGTPTTINSGDMAGILMAAIKGLERRTAELKEKDGRIAELEARLKILERLVHERPRVTASPAPGVDHVHGAR